MSDKLNTTGLSLFEKFNVNGNGNVIQYNDYKNTQNIKKSNIELTDFEQPTNNYITYTNGVKNINFAQMKRGQFEDEEENRSTSSSKQLNNSLINCIWSIRQTLNIIIFVKKLKEYCRGYLFKSLTRQTFNIIGDQSSQYNYYVVNGFIKSKEKMSILMKWREVKQKRKLFQQCIRKIEGSFYNCFKKTVRTIDPRNKIKIAWDAIVFILLSVNIFYVPIYIAWEENLGMTYSHDSRILSLTLHDIPGWIFFLDIALNFITCYYEEGKLITSRRRIFLKYMKGKFWGDIIVLIPFLISKYVHIKYFNIILLLRINNLMKRLSQFEEMIDLSPNEQILYDLTKITTIIIFIAHFLGCFFYLLGLLQTQYGMKDNWLTLSGIPRQFFTEYVNCLYWATITLVTIGYGDLTPKTNYEKIFVMLVSLIGCCYYATILSAIGSILSYWQQRMQEKRKKVSSIISFLKKRGVDKMLQYKVKKYIAYAYEQDLEYENEASNILNALSTPLQKEIEKSILIQVFKKISFIQNNYSDVFIYHLINALKSKECEAGEIILEKNQIGDSICFVMNGQFHQELDVKPYKKYDQTLTLETYNNLESFGDYCFLTNRPSPGRFLSTQNSLIKFLTKRDFESIIQLYPKDYEFYRMYITAQKKCQVCKDDSHFYFQCPYTSLRLYKNRILNSFTKPQFNERSHIQRFRMEKKKSLCIIDQIRSSSIQYLFDTEMLENVESIEALLGDEQFQVEISDNEDLVEKMKIADKVKEIYDIKENQDTKDVPLEPVSQIKPSTAYTIQQHIIDKKKDLQFRESYRYTNHALSTRDKSNNIFWNKEKIKEVKELLEVNQFVNSQNQKRDHQNEVFTPYMEKIKNSGEQIEKILLAESHLLDDQKKFSHISNIDRICHFQIYYPQGNFNEISRQKKRIKFFGKQKLKQSVEAIRKLMVFKSKMENSVQRSQSSNISLQNTPIGKSNNQIISNHSLQKQFKKKVNIVTPSNKSILSIPDSKIYSMQSDFDPQLHNSSFI